MNKQIDGLIKKEIKRRNKIKQEIIERLGCLGVKYDDMIKITRQINDYENVEIEIK